MEPSQVKTDYLNLAQEFKYQLDHPKDFDHLEELLNHLDLGTHRGSKELLTMMFYVIIKQQHQIQHLSHQVDGL